jgi:hypothetical protein
MNARIQLHLVTEKGTTIPVSIDVTALAYFHAVEHPWCDKAKCDLLVNDRLVTVSESFAEIAGRIAEALAPNDEPWTTQP